MAKDNKKAEPFVSPVDVVEYAVSMRKIGHDRYVVSRLKLKGSKVIERAETSADPLNHSAAEVLRQFSGIIGSIE